MSPNQAAFSTGVIASDVTVRTQERDIELVEMCIKIADLTAALEEVKAAQQLKSQYDPSRLSLALKSAYNVACAKQHRKQP